MCFENKMLCRSFELQFVEAVESRPVPARIVAYAAYTFPRLLVYLVTPHW
jgi:hypothetical protein